MELNEAARRILGRHWLLILLVVALGVGVAALLHRGDEKTYTASTRLVLDTPDPESSQESAAIADAAKAIATSPGQVRDALNRAHVTGRDPEEVAEDHVSVRALGTSAVLRLSVSDPDPRVAATISNALAASLIRTRSDVARGEIQQVLSGLDRQIAELNQRISRTDAGIDLLSTRAGAAKDADRANALRVKSDDAARSRDALAQRRGVLESERVSLLSSDAVRPKASIISQASPPSSADSSRRLPDLVLGALLGLILGVGLAALIETVRPTLVGRNALAREFDTPLVGMLSRDPAEGIDLDDAIPIGMRLRLAAEATDVRNVGLLPVGPYFDLEPLANMLDAASANPERVLVGALQTPTPDWEEKGEASQGRSDIRIRPFPESTSLNHGGVNSLVLVSPTTLKKSELVDTSHLLRATRLPVLGLIAYKPSRWRWRAQGRARAVEGQTRDQV
jgi:capsular polysaccharide biosynthesis protein